MTAYDIINITDISQLALQWRIVDYLINYHRLKQTDAISMAKEYCWEQERQYIPHTRVYRSMCYAGVQEWRGKRSEKGGEFEKS